MGGFMSLRGQKLSRSQTEIDYDAKGQFGYCGLGKQVQDE